MTDDPPYDFIDPDNDSSLDDGSGTEDAAAAQHGSVGRKIRKLLEGLR